MWMILKRSASARLCAMGEVNLRESFKRCRSHMESRLRPTHRTSLKFQGNSIAKRRFGPIIDITRSLLLGARHLPDQLWGETLKAAVYFKSRTPTDVLGGKATLDIWENEPLGNVNHMYEWEELVFKQTAIRQNNGKLTTRAKKMRLEATTSDQGFVWQQGSNVWNISS